MALYHLHARLFEGSLAAPTRDELHTRERDDYGVAVTLAEELASRGFSVWLYVHDASRGLTTNGEGAYRVSGSGSRNEGSNLCRELSERFGLHVYGDPDKSRFGRIATPG